MDYLAGMVRFGIEVRISDWHLLAFVGVLLVLGGLVYYLRQKYGYRK